MSRALVAVLAVVATVLGAACGEAHAARRAPACPADAVAVAHHGHRACLAFAPLRRRLGVAAAGTPRLLTLAADAALARRLGNRSVRRLPAPARALGLRLARQAAVLRPPPAQARGARVHPAARAAETATELLPGGGSQTLTVQPAPPGQSGEGSSASITKEVTMSGKPVEATVGFGTEKFAALCPGVAGEDPGRVSFHQGTELTTPLEHRLRLVVASQFDGTGLVTGHVGADGRLRDFDVAVDLTFTVRGRIIGPAGLVHGDPFELPLRFRVVFVGLHPAQALDEVMDIHHVGSLSMSGPEGTGRIEAHDGGLFMPKQFIDAYLTGAMLLVSNARWALKDTQVNYFDEARCLKAVFAPDPLPDSTIGDRRDAAVSVVSTVDGAEQSFDVALTPAAVVLSATRLHVAPGTPAPFWFTVSAPGLRAGMNVGADVNGTSVRGRLVGAVSTRIVDLPQAWSYAVALTGTGTYAERRAHVDPGTQIEHHAATAFTYEADWGEVVLPADGSASLAPTSFATGGHLTGGSESSGTYHSSAGQSASYHCSGPLADLSAAQPEALRLQMAPANGGSHPFTVTAAQSLSVDPGQGSCTTDGAFFSSMLPATGGLGLVDLPPALVGRSTYDDDTVGTRSFSTDVSAGALPEHCTLGDQGADQCTHTLSWSGRMTFTRTGRCASAAGGGYACKREATG